MSKLDVNDALLVRLIGEVAPLVGGLTGWDLRLAGLRQRVLPKNQGYEEIVEGKLRALGLPVNPRRDLITRAVEYLVENNVLAAYEPLNNELLVIRENVDDSNLDGLRLLLGHELTHRAQHMRHPEIFEYVNRTLVSLLDQAEYGSDPMELRTQFENVQPVMTLIESHASYIQASLHQRYYPDAIIETRFTLPVILFQLLGYGKTAQYTDGLPAVNAAMRHGTVDGLFGSLAQA